LTVTVGSQRCFDAQKGQGYGFALPARLAMTSVAIFASRPAVYPIYSIPSSARRTNAANNRAVRSRCSSVTIGTGNRVARCTTATCSAGEREVNDGSQFVLARSSSGVITDVYGYYPGGDQPMSLQLPSGRTGVFITDPQLRGTVRAIADADKNATNPEFKTYAVSPWGEVAADTGSITRLRMAGQQYDQGSELYYMRARYYDPELGRFLSEDPIGISGGLNLYAYAGNDPVNRSDPSGTNPMGNGPCELPDGRKGVLDKNGICVPADAYELPDITVSSRKLPRQGRRSEVDFHAAIGLGKWVRDGCRPRLL
jgi:RHS repeat-associated protein